MPIFNFELFVDVEAEDEMRAVFALNKSLYPLSENEIEKFNAFHIEEVSE